MVQPFLRGMFVGYVTAAIRVNGRKTILFSDDRRPRRRPVSARESMMRAALNARLAYAQRIIECDLGGE